MARGVLPVAGLLAALLLLGCGEKQQRSEQLSKAEIEGQWRYENDCAECHENQQPD